MQEVENGVHRVRGHDPVDQADREVEQVLDRMHGEAGPRTRIDVSMMQLVHRVVEPMRVDEAMHRIEVKVSPQWDDKNSATQ